MEFKKASREQKKARIAICGTAGSGKTWGALELATVLGKKIALIDTEASSASLYADKFTFDTLQLQPPFEADRYVAAIDAAEKAGYDVLIIDSLSHAWAGEGGLLDKHGKLADREKNSFTAWRHVTPDHNRLVDKMLRANMNVIVTMRSKTEYSIEKDGERTVIKKMGMAPVQREGVDYEFDIVLDVDQASHTATASKDRTTLFNNRIVKINKQVGEDILNWMKSGVSKDPLVEELNALLAVNEPRKAKLLAHYRVDNAEQLNGAQLKEAIELLKKPVAEPAKAEGEKK